MSLSTRKISFHICFLASSCRFLTNLLTIPDRLIRLFWEMNLQCPKRELFQILHTSDTETNDVFSNVMEMTISMKAQMDHTNDTLAAFMVERKHPPPWALVENHNPSFQCLASTYESNSLASKNAILEATQTASLAAAQTATSQASQTAPLLAVQTAISQPAQADPILESTETSINPMQRSSEEDILRFCAG